MEAVGPALGAASACFSIVKYIRGLEQSTRAAATDLDRCQRRLEICLHKAVTLMDELNDASYNIPPHEMDWVSRAFVDLQDCVAATRARLPTKRDGRYRRRDRLWYGHNRNSVARDVGTVMEYWEVFNPSWLLERESRCQMREMRDSWQQARRGEGPRLPRAESPYTDIDFQQISEVEYLIE